MKIAFYKGIHQSISGIFNILVKWKMGGQYSHVEVLFDKTENKTYTCASSSFIDGGVRFKNVEFDPTKWNVIDVPGLDENKMRQWFKDHEGEPYDVRGLINFIIPVGHTANGWFCDEAVLAAMGMTEPDRFDPNALACICLFIGGKLVTDY